MAHSSFVTLTVLQIKRNISGSRFCHSGLGIQAMPTCLTKSRPRVMHLILEYWKFFTAWNWGAAKIWNFGVSKCNDGENARVNFGSLKCKYKLKVFKTAAPACQRPENTKGPWIPQNSLGQRTWASNLALRDPWNFIIAWKSKFFEKSYQAHEIELSFLHWQKNVHKQFHIKI